MPSLSSLPDVLSDLLGLLRMRAETVCANEYSAPWSFTFGRPLAHFHIIERGTATLTLHDGASDRLEAGDLVILPLGAGHVLSSQAGLTPVPIEEAIQQRGVREDRVYRLGGGGEETHVVCGQFSFASVLAGKLLGALPAVIHLRPAAGQPLQWLRATSQLLVEETRFPKSGSVIMATRLIDLLFIQAIREWGTRALGQTGWAAGLADLRVGRALSAIHSKPAAAWTVGELADVAGLSRSAFAARFASLVGCPPLKYVASWRLDLAAHHLRAGKAGIGEIAALVGYGSEAALCRAFKAQFGVTPAVFRRNGSGM